MEMGRNEKARLKAIAPNEEKEMAITPEALRAAARPNTDIAIASINASKDKGWLRDFRARMAPRGESQIIAAIDNRLAELDEMEFCSRIGSAITGLTLVERVGESLRVYEAFLARKHDKNIRASRTKTMIKRWGEKEAMRRTVTNLDMSNGLESLAQYGRLDYSYEQIILDFPHEFDQTLRAKARANLRRLPEQKPPWSCKTVPSV
jgi:hypothetical protein